MAISIIRRGLVPLALSAALLGAAPPPGANRLPLKVGVYVRAGATCEGASNVDTLSYWGGDGGVNDQQDRCTARRIARRGKIYTLTETCENLRFGGRFAHSQVVEIESPTAFRTEGRTYRWCRDLRG